jgi:hypothetical protein
MDPATSGGLLITVFEAPGCWKNEEAVAVEDVEFDLVGDDGRPVTVAVVEPDGPGAVEIIAAGVGSDPGNVEFVNELDAVAEGKGSGRKGLDCVRWWPVPGKGEGGAMDEVGVGIGVFCDESEAVWIMNEALVVAGSGM